MGRLYGLDRGAILGKRKHATIGWSNTPVTCLVYKSPEPVFLCAGQTFGKRLHIFELRRDDCFSLDVQKAAPGILAKRNKTFRCFADPIIVKTE